MGDLRILMYHAIGAAGEPAERFVLPIEDFERQMAWLAGGGFPVLSLGDAVRSLLCGEEPLPGAVAITFDDGTRDQSTLAFPILERHGFPATAFVVTGAMGGALTWTDQPGLGGRALMTWPEALALEPLVSLAPHTRTHASLPTLSDDELADEIHGSREDLEARTGHPATVFAYPYGHFDARVAAVVSGGFAAACTAEIGPNDVGTPPYELRRYEVRGDRTFSRFEGALSRST